MKTRHANPRVWLAGLVFFLLAGCDSVSADDGDNGATDTITVMTRNMYVGADLDNVLAAPSPEAIPGLVAEAWATLQQTNYPERARAMAAEIAQAQPHLVGLQEVSLIRTQVPGDAVLGGTTPAEDVAFDFLPTLLEELESLGHDYRVVAEIQNTDIELPRLNPDFTFTDVRLTDFDAILARSDVEVSNGAAQNFEASFMVFGVEVKRGWVAVDATVAGQVYRFVNTHLEPAGTANGHFQTLQATELIEALAAETRPVILVGDLNTAAPGGATYDEFLAAGYSDTWTYRPRPLDPGFTCCYAKDLSSPTQALEKRIDLVFVRNAESLLPPSSQEPVQVRLVGAEPQDRTPSGLWPSDHAGVVARLAFLRD